MPMVPYTNCLEPAEDAVIWRYIDLRKFRDLMASEVHRLRLPPGIRADRSVLYGAR